MGQGGHGAGDRGGRGPWRQGDRGHGAVKEAFPGICEFCFSDQQQQALTGLLWKLFASQFLFFFKLLNSSLATHLYEWEVIHIELLSS